jgi:archaellum component FlaC
MSNFKAAEAIKTNIAKLETLFDKMVDGEIEATDAQQQKVIDRLDALNEDLSNELAGLNGLWGVA